MLLRAVWREGDAYRLRLLRCVEPTGHDETLAGIPVSGEAHAALARSSGISWTGAPPMKDAAAIKQHSNAYAG